ncbi:outer membrane protein assembly factor BamE [Neptunomonas qingdaonensis]|uniref:Outer membrane protein assembly factor BamE n=1 Tax=Neptunomonas qingdaonensis TaxID=1045558 RepID=A0A1I2MH51_9GAMM|nr:outer membrane protein assembly factor BamE [Neptunomonas qingdaonensis]SFF88847.1 outer membrane protein assembly factor BamE [Neptunomonas qingdaonensis]
MRKFLISIIAVTLLSGCSEFPGVYKIDIPQGNIISQEMVDELKPGMNYSQVRYVLGTPLVVDTFNGERWDYIYTFKKGGETRTQEQLSVFFTDGKLTSFSGDYKPSGTTAE